MASAEIASSHDAYIVAAGRTPIGCFCGALASVSAVELASQAVSAVVKQSGIPVDAFQEIFIGNVLSSGLGQNVARQVALGANLPASVCATTVNKVCASGLKAVALGAQSIRLGLAQCVVTGGTESMSNAPHLIPRLRCGVKYGHSNILDSLVVDGLTDAVGQFAMGVAAEKCAKKYGISREQQDAHAVESYTRAIRAKESGYYDAEMVPIAISPSNSMRHDEQLSKFAPAKIPMLRPVFSESSTEGTVTAANASPLSDGAAAMVLVSLDLLRKLVYDCRLQSANGSVFRILSFADAEQEPLLFTTSPAVAIPIALERCHLRIEQVDYFEINEAFSCVAIATGHLLGLDPNKVNVFGGAVALGHPLGCSGARILCTLMNVLCRMNAKIGCAAICNGGGGATACVIERIPLSEIAAASGRNNL